MNYRDMSEQIKKGEFSRVYLMHGEEAFVRQRLLDRLCAAAVNRDMAQLNITNFGEDADAGSIIEACETLPVFDERRVVIYKDCPMLKSKGKDMGEKRLLEYIENVPEHAILVFYMRQKPDGRKALFKKLKPYNVEFKQLGEREIYSWLKADLKRQGYEIDAHTVEVLTFRVGMDMGGIVTEIEKAQAYVYPEKVITTEAIQAVSTPGMEADAFELTDCVLSGEYKKAEAKLDTILENGGAIQAVIGAVNYRLQSLAEARAMLDAGLSASAAAGKLKGPKFATTRTVNTAKRFSTKTLNHAICALAEADYSIKTGQMNDRVALESMLVSSFLLGKRKEAKENPVASRR